jgi:hypothetical protein
VLLVCRGDHVRLALQWLDGEVEGDPRLCPFRCLPDPNRGIEALMRTARTARTRSHVRSAVIAVSALALSSTLPAIAFAAPADAGSQVSATLVLRSPDPTAVGALATAHGLSRSQRMARLAATMPSAAVRSSAQSSVAALGLTVDHTTPWTVVVHGSTRAVGALTASAASRSGVFAENPSLVPAAATVISGGATGVFHPRALGPLTGADFRTAYNASSLPPSGATAPVIATIQLADWDPADLSSYALANGLPAPTAATYTQISVDNDPLTPTDDDDSIEPAIDQESIYSVNPYADQRAYFAPNTTQHYIDAIYQVAADAYSSASIVALSVSWGSCETDTGSLNIDSMHAAIAQVLAAGVTMFAASGDNGSHDCTDDSGNPVQADAVDYPASDPLVVAVGGTQLDPVGPVETAWSDAGMTPQAFSGSGGGVSVDWARPAYQATVAPAATMREVPDIAADAASASPFEIYVEGTNFHAWGTSLAAPVSAALLTAELGSRGLTNGGVGDIHQALYSAPATSFRDITSGTNLSYNAGPGYDMVTGLGAVNWHAVVDQLTLAPVVSVPTAGKSTTIHVAVTNPGGQQFLSWQTGFGTPPACSNNAGKAATPADVVVPKDGVYTIYAVGYLGYQRCLIGTATTIVDNSPPAASANITKSSPSGKTVTYSWAVSDKLSGVGSISTRLLRNGKLISTGHPLGSGKVVIKGKLGSVYQLVVTAADKLGNTITAKHSMSVAYDDRSFTLVGKGWKRVNSHAAFGGQLVTSAKAGTTAHLKVYGQNVYLLTTTCSTCGIVGVYVNGKHLHDISLYTKGSHPQNAVKIATFGSAALRSITLLVKGTKASGSKGVTVSLDGLLAS